MTTRTQRGDHLMQEAERIRRLAMRMRIPNVQRFLIDTAEDHPNDDGDPAKRPRLASGWAKRISRKMTNELLSG
jgi:hypothetical protein